jgi:hypothetical protein
MTGDTSPSNPQLVTLTTSKGPVDVLYDLREEGETLHLKDIAIYARQSEPLFGVLRELLAARSQIARYAREAGFAKLRISGHRSLASSSTNPGKPIDVTIDLSQGQESAT